jgi:hypothetical protein
MPALPLRFFEHPARVFDDYPSSEELSRSARAPGAGDGYTLVAGNPTDLR